MLDPRLYTFLVLCDTMNYTRAAQRLCITQPAVTHHIHFLEDHYGCRLFLYQGKTLSLTPAGERLRELARSLAYNSSKMERAVSAARPVFLRVGATRTIGEYVVAPLVERFLRAHPEGSCTLTVDNTRALLGALEAGELDFALVEGFFDREKYSSRLYRREEFLGVCHPAHPLAGRQVSLEEVLGERLVVREEGSGTRAILEEALRRHNCTLKSFRGVVTIGDLSVIKALVEQGLGVSFLYRPAAEGELARGTLASFSLGEEPLEGAFSFVWLRDNLFAGEWADWIE